MELYYGITLQEITERQTDRQRHRETATFGPKGRAQKRGGWRGLGPRKMPQPARQTTATKSDVEQDLCLKLLQLATKSCEHVERATHNSHAQ